MYINSGLHSITCSTKREQYYRIPCIVSKITTFCRTIEWLNIDIMGGKNSTRSWASTVTQPKKTIKDMNKNMATYKLYSNKLSSLLYHYHNNEMFGQYRLLIKEWHFNNSVKKTKRERQSTLRQTWQWTVQSHYMEYSYNI